MLVTVTISSSWVENVRQEILEIWVDDVDEQGEEGTAGKTRNLK